MGARRPTLVYVPSDDEAFIEHVSGLVAETAVQTALDRLDHGELERRLRTGFPKATVRPREELARIHPDDPPVWYVSRGRERFRLRSAVSIAMPRADVFRLYVDPAAIRRWQQAASVRVLASTSEVVGTSWKAEYQILRIRLGGVFRIVEAEPPARIRVEASGPLRSRLWYVTRFTERDGQTIVEVQGDYELPFELLTRLPSRLVAEREIERVVAASHERLKMLAEGRSSRPGRARQARPRGARVDTPPALPADAAPVVEPEPAETRDAGSYGQEAPAQATS